MIIYKRCFKNITSSFSPTLPIPPHSIPLLEVFLGNGSEEPLCAGDERGRDFSNHPRVYLSL